MIISSNSLLYLAFDKIPSSILLAVISLRTLTSFLLPILWALSWACKSYYGFQSVSKIITVSADCKFKPSPPALVESKNTLNSLFGMLKSLWLSPLSSDLVEPSSLRYLLFYFLKNLLFYCNYLKLHIYY